MKKINSFFKITIGLSLLMVFNLAGFSQPVAPSPAVQSSSQDALLIKWAEVPEASRYKIETSLDSAVFNEFKTVDTTAYDYLIDGEFVELINGLNEGTEYFIRITSYDGATQGGSAGFSALTLSSELVVHLPFNEIQGDTAIVNAVNSDYDTGIHGQVEIIEAGTSGLNAPAIKFTQDPLAGTESYVELDNILLPYMSSMLSRTVSVWIKPDAMPVGDAVSMPVSLLKRTGMSIMLYHDTIWAVTKHRVKGDEYAVAAFAPFNSTDWTHVAWVFDEPYTSLYINGEEVSKVEENLPSFYKPSWFPTVKWPYPARWLGTDGDKSPEIGSQFDPDMADVAFANGSWDPGYRNAFSGMLADLRMFNYSLTADDLQAIISEAKPSAPTVKTPAVSSEKIMVVWTKQDDASSYKLYASTDSVNFEEIASVDTATTDAVKGEYIYTYEGLSSGTQYYIKAVALSGDVESDPTVISATTIEDMMLIHLPFNEIQGDTAIVNAVNSDYDTGIHGEVSIREAGQETDQSGLKVPSIYFNQDALSGVQSYIELDNILLPFMDGMIERSVSFAFKLDAMPINDEKASPISLLKRTGMSVIIYNDSIWANTKHRVRGNEYAMTAVAPFSSTEWTHVTWTFNEPYTTLFINGLEVAKVSENDPAMIGPDWFPVEKWPYPSNWLGTGGDKSPEIGAQYDPDMGDIAFLNGTWDPGFRHAFKGMLADLRMYNYELSSNEINTIMEGIFYPTSVSEVTFAEMKVYPNPAQDLLYFNEEITGKVRLFDETGRLIMEKILNDSNNLNVAGLDQGLYIMKIYFKDEVFTNRVSILR